MTTEVDVPAEDSFVAGFNSVREPSSTEPVTPAEPQTEEPVQDVVEQEEPKETPKEEPAKEEAPEAKELIAGLTQEQLIALLNKAERADERIDKVFNKYGELNRTLQQIQSNSGKISAEKMTRMREQFPELADILIEDLNDALTIGASDQGAFEKTLAEKLAEQEQKFKQDMEAREQQREIRMLNRRHADWKDVVAEDKFNLWKQNVLAKEQREQLETSWDADFIADRIDEYKEWTNRATKAKGEKQKRLESAVATEGTGTGASNQLKGDPFVEGFNKVRQGRY